MMRLARVGAPAQARRLNRSAFQVRAFSQFKYLPSHEYIKMEADGVTGVMGISDFAQSQLGDVVYVELPVLSESVEQGALISSVESVKAASDVYAPVSGEIIEINEEIADAPELINQGAMTTAWFCKIKLSDPSELDNLMDEAAYKKHCEEGDDH